MLPPKSAAMVPLAHDTRTEIVVVYYSNDWEDLSLLLEAPLEFLRGQQFLWKQDSEDSVPWQLLTPLSATIEYGFGSIDNILTTFSYFGDVLDTSITPDRHLAALAEKAKDASRGAANFEVAGLRPEALFSATQQLAGSFLVQFAAYTNSIRILYYPPTRETVALADMDRGGPRYKGGIDKPSFIASASGIASSQLHFDLTESSHRMRADFLVTQLENPYHVANLLNEKLDDGEVLAASYSLVPATPDRPLLRAAPRHPSPLPNDARFVPGIQNWIYGELLRSAKEPAVDLAELIERLGVYGTVIAHNLSEPIELFVCSNPKCQPVTTPEGEMIGMGTMVVESYARVLFDSKFVVDKHVGRS